MKIACIVRVTLSGVNMTSLTATAVGNQVERWIRFEGGVNQKSGAALTRAADYLVANGTRKIHLMINSMGGDIFAGQAAFNHLRMLRLEVATYNTGTVQSMAVQLFCAGTRRFCLPNATFFIHPVQWYGKDGQILVSGQLRDFANACDKNTRNIAQIIAGQIGKPLEEVLANMNATKTFNAEESKAYGLVHEIVTPDFFPVGVAYAVIEEDGSIREYPAQQKMDPVIEELLSGKTLDLPKISTYNPGLPTPPKK